MSVKNYIVESVAVPGRPNVELVNVQREGDDSSAFFQPCLAGKPAPFEDHISIQGSKNSEAVCADRARDVLSELGFSPSTSVTLWSDVKNALPLLRAKQAMAVLGSRIGLWQEKLAALEILEKSWDKLTEEQRTVFQTLARANFYAPGATDEFRTAAAWCSVDSFDDAENQRFLAAWIRQYNPDFMDSETLPPKVAYERIAKISGQLSPQVEAALRVKVQEQLERGGSAVTDVADQIIHLFAQKSRQSKTELMDYFTELFMEGSGWKVLSAAAEEMLRLDPAEGLKRIKEHYYSEDGKHCGNTTVDVLMSFYPTLGDGWSDAKRDVLAIFTDALSSKRIHVPEQVLIVEVLCRYPQISDEDIKEDLQDKLEDFADHWNPLWPEKKIVDAALQNFAGNTTACPHYVRPPDF